MPCGPLYPFIPLAAPGNHCFQCGRSDGVLDHWCEEWDCSLHAACCFAFLASPEGQTMLEHGHGAAIVLNGMTHVVESARIKGNSQPCPTP